MQISKILTITILAGFFATMGCGQKDEEENTPPPAPREIFHVFSFDGTMGNRYMLHFGKDGSQATLYTHNETLILKHQPAASGAKYQGERIMVWIKGDDVLFEVDGKRIGPCVVSGLQSILAKAWLSGMDFWAVGNEPTWNLSMGKDQVILLTEMGQKRMEFEALGKDIPDPRKPYGLYSFTNKEKHELVVEISEGRCTDIMSGEPFAVSVRLVLDGKELLGCGTGLF